MLKEVEYYVDTETLKKYRYGTIVFYIYSLDLYAGYNNWKWKF